MAKPTNQMSRRQTVIGFGAVALGSIGSGTMINAANALSREDQLGSKFKVGSKKRYVFSSDPRAKHAGFSVLPG